MLKQGKTHSIFQVQNFFWKIEKKIKSNKSQGQREVFFQIDLKFWDSELHVVKKGLIFLKNLFLLSSFNMYMFNHNIENSDSIRFYKICFLNK